MKDTLLRIVDSFWKMLDKLPWGYGLLGFFWGGFLVSVVDALTKSPCPYWLNCVIVAVGALFLVGLGWCLYNAPIFIAIITFSVAGCLMVFSQFGMPGLQAYLAFVLLCILVYIAVLLTIQVSKMKEEEERERRRVEEQVRLIENQPYMSALHELAELEELGKGLEDHGGIDAKKRCENIVEAVEKLGEEYLKRQFTENELAKIEEFKKRIRDAREKNEAERLK
ncbi:MAG: hypothetical protein E7198_09085 [Schwartzia succinivorans]|jgi:uncharacterized membrane protein|uniref:hypothetical protein n=1 Tax=Schwartzia succinivorans TaxID=55507 RepID=UPI002356BD52|nr:hypothetical protein [Schwartzia succinivorans]MBE6097933.1 hypothetical protein [Schwartzia succinivorans]